MERAFRIKYKNRVGMKKVLEKMGFRPMSRLRGEIEEDTIFYEGREYQLSSAREEGYIYVANGLKAKVWTTVLLALVMECDRKHANAPPLLKPAVAADLADVIVSSPPGIDMGWVLIADLNDNAQYFSVPFPRTAGFMKALCSYARIAQIKVQNRPRCERCGMRMEIFVNKKRQTYWVCDDIKFHKPQERVSVDWDHKLPEAAKLVLAKRRKKRAKDKKRNLEKALAEGKKPPTPARFIRQERKMLAKKAS
jgi:hypothetical protein